MNNLLNRQAGVNKVLQGMGVDNLVRLDLLSEKNQERAKQII